MVSSAENAVARKAAAPIYRQFADLRRELVQVAHQRGAEAGQEQVRRQEVQQRGSRLGEHRQRAQQRHRDREQRDQRQQRQEGEARRGLRQPQPPPPPCEFPQERASALCWVVDRRRAHAGL